MKLQPAMMFAPNMVLQRDKPIPVWGRSVRGDTVTVTLNGVERRADCPVGEWKTEFPPMPATECTEMTIQSAITGESLHFGNVAIGEVWLAGGQSNMEFLLKYDEGAEEMKATPKDEGLRYFRYPQTSFLGNLERDLFPDDGFWRVWDSPENIGFFSGPAAYMGRKLRQALGVPVGFVGCNWGGTPAAAWTSLEDLKANPALKPVLDWQADVCAKLDWAKYEQDAEVPAGEPSEEQKAMNEAFMMGGDPAELMKKFTPKPPEGYSPFVPGPKAAVRPAGLYQQILCHVAPYAVRGVIWYQGEDDDAREWHEFYDESMKTLINSWRKLWKEQLPFLQVELAPLDEGLGKALHYAVIREKQRAAMDALDQVHNVCILDAGDAHNIHVRKKRPVGERLALLAEKYVYHMDVAADSPRLSDARRKGDTVELRFRFAEDGLVWKPDPDVSLRVEADGVSVTPEVSAQGDAMRLRCPAFAGAGKISIRYDEENYCVAGLFNSAGLPAFAFTVTLDH